MSHVLCAVCCAGERLLTPARPPPPSPTQRTFDNLRELGSSQSPGLSDLHDSGRGAGDTHGVSWVVNDNTSIDGLEASPRIGVCVCACVCVLCVYCIVCASASLT